MTGTLVISDATNMFECFSVPLVDDNIPESEECFNTMIAPDGVQPDLIIIQSQSEICIIDNDDGKSSKLATMEPQSGHL